MREELLQLAFSIYKNKGVYALLLGSGISSAADIPTGWSITLDLIQQIAALLGEDVGAKPDEWYQAKYGQEPRYDDLIEKLGRRPTERTALLKGYFEPTDEEREQGRKIPTKAHKAIAWLIKEGYIRVVLTTNFDRLLENALVDVAFDVIYSDAMFSGKQPLRHSPPTIIKLHGDYRNNDILNTTAELAVYSVEKNKWLDQIFDEYGLIVCGWSGTWDTALRDAILRQPSRRYSTFWSSYGDITDEAKELIQLRDAQRIENMDADTFFSELCSMVEDIATSKRENPVTISVLVARTKRLIERKLDIELEDLIRAETQYGVQQITNGEFRLSAKNHFQPKSGSEEICFKAIEKPLHVFTAFLWYDSDKKRKADFLINTVKNWNVYPADEFYPLEYLADIYLIYAAGICLTFKHDWGSLRRVFNETRLKANYKQVEQLPFTDVLLGKMFFEGLYNDTTIRIPNWNHAIYETLKQVFVPTYLSEKDYSITFDLFELLLDLNYLGLRKDDTDKWQFLNRLIENASSWEDIEHFFIIGAKQGHNWPLLTSRLIAIDVVALEDLLRKYSEIVKLLIEAESKPSASRRISYLRQYAYRPFSNLGEIYKENLNKA